MCCTHTFDKGVRYAAVGAFIEHPGETAGLLGHLLHESIVDRQENL